jgi:predicted nucleic acid-binding protein
MNDANLAVSAFVALRLPLFGTDPMALAALLPSAFQLAAQLQTSFYDAVFLAAADLLDLPLVTADDRFHRRVSSKSPVLVLWIGSLDLS